MAEAKEQEFISAVQAFVCVSSTDIPLAKTSDLAKVKVCEGTPHTAKLWKGLKFNALYQTEQRELKIYPWLMMKKGNESLNN